MADCNSISSLVRGFPFACLINKSLLGYCHDHLNGFISECLSSVFLVIIGTERVAEVCLLTSVCVGSFSSSSIDHFFLILSKKLTFSSGIKPREDSFSILFSNSSFLFLSRFSSCGDSFFFSSCLSRIESEKLFNISICFLYAYPLASQNCESIFR